MKITNKHVFFWSGIFSNWHPASFQFCGNNFANSEQAFMWSKAITFNDEETAALILKEINPKEVKKLGRLIKGFDEITWNEKRYGCMYNVLLDKFMQNEEMLQVLLATGDKILAEASPYDKIWGIGMDENEPGIEDESNWKGENLLGRVLMDVREYYREFNEYVGGRLAIALFKGEFNDELFTIIRMAEARGQKYQWEESNKPKEK